MNRNALWGLSSLRNNIEHWRDVMKYDPEIDAPESETVHKEIAWHCDLILNSFDFMFATIVSYLHEHDDRDSYPLDAYLKRFFPDQYKVLKEAEEQ